MTTDEEGQDGDRRRGQLEGAGDRKKYMKFEDSFAVQMIPQNALQGRCSISAVDSGTSLLIS